ncbi:MAG TPA: ATP-binding protein [Methylomirabilota bacterium]|nr:ATP-binding protein [Methylomirabilota bacterium]
MRLPLQSGPVRYVLTLLLVLAAALARHALDPWWGGTLPFLTFFPAVVAAAWVGGLGPGLLATFLGGLLAFSFWMSPAHGAGGLAALALYAGIGALFSLMTAQLHGARRTAEQSLARDQAAHVASEAGYEASLRLAAIIQGSDDAIVGKTLDGIITSWNPGAERMFGYPAQEAIGQSITLIIPEERIAEEQMVIARLREGQAIEHFETVRRRKDGERITVSLTVSPIRNAGGQIIGASKIARDITLQARAEAERAELLAREQAARQRAEAAEQHAHFLADASRVLAAALDYEATLAQIVHLAVPRLADMAAVDLVEPNGRIRRVAAAHLDPAKEQFLLELRNTYGFNPDGTKGVPGVIKTRRPSLVTSVTDDDLVAAATSPQQLETLRALGMRSWMIVPLIAHDAVLGALTFVTTDSGRRYSLTDQRLAEAVADRASSAMENAQLYRRAEAARADAEQASRAKDDFLATLSHELRTPLTAVYGWARVLQTVNDDTMRAKAIDVILRNSRMQVQMIDDLLDVSRIVTGKMRLDVQPVDVAAVVEAALDSVRPATESKALRLQMVLDPRAGPVAGDADRLQQVVWNLLMNAVKFTPRGGRIQVELQRVRSLVQVRVSDTGQGIHEDDLPHIFDRFRQGEAGNARSHGGLGIGLALVRHLVELHGGSVAAHSEGLGKGATFTVTLPLSIARAPAAAARSDDPGAVRSAYEGPPLRGLTIVVVDDDRDGLDLISTIVQSAGAAVIACASPDEGFARVSERRPDLIVSDIEMPGEDGYSLIRRIRALPAERGGRAPALAVTAYGRSEDRIRALTAGFTMHLAKPVDPDELVTVLASMARADRSSSAAG